MKININQKYSIDKTTPLVVGTSSGPDSMALLHYLKNNTNNPIICCHINHNIRKESQEEEFYLKEYCKQQNIIFETMKIEKYQENNFENEARKKRYSFYEEILKNCSKVLNDKFLIAFEMGQTQGEAIKFLAHTYLSNITVSIEKDMQGLDRFVFIKSN